MIHHPSEWNKTHKCVSTHMLTGKYYFFIQPLRFSSRVKPTELKFTTVDSTFLHLFKVYTFKLTYTYQSCSQYKCYKLVTRYSWRLVLSMMVICCHHHTYIRWSYVLDRSLKTPINMESPSNPYHPLFVKRPLSICECPFSDKIFVQFLC